MPADPHEDELDQILESGLVSYASPEPWPGLEQRVLSRLSRETSRRRVWLRWVVPIPVLAAALLLVIVLMNRKEPVPARLEVARRAETESVPVAPGPAPIARVPRYRPARFSEPAPLPKARTFPAPNSLSEEERALARLAASNPRALETALVAREHMKDPITVEPIHIPLLDNGQSMED